MKRCTYHQDGPGWDACSDDHYGPCDLGDWGVEACAINAAPAMLHTLLAIVASPPNDNGNIVVSSTVYAAAVAAVAAATPKKEPKPMIDAILVDIDGTLADIRHRLKYIAHPHGRKQWGAFFDAMSDDKPIEPTIKLVKTLIADSGYAGASEVLFVTGRPDSHRQQTLDWLCDHVTPLAYIQLTKLYMRREGDHRDDILIKRQILDQIRADGFNPTIAIDDRASVVEMWREEGLICLQAAKGDF